MARLAAAGELRRAPAGVVLIEQDSTACDLNVIVRGAVKVVRSMGPSAGSSTVVLDVAVAPTLVGGESLFDGRAQTASLVTLQPTQMIVIARDQALLVAASQPKLGRALLAHLTHTLRARVRRLDEVMSGPVEDRVRRLLGALDREHGIPMVGGRLIPLPLRRRDIASMVDATTETVSRILARLEREGLTRTTMDGIWLRSGPDGGTEIRTLPPSGPQRHSVAG